MPGLNKLSPQSIAQRAIATEAALEERAPEDDEARGTLLLDLALYRLAGDDPPETLLPLFRAAAQHLARSLAAGPQAGPDPWAAQDFLAVVGAFGNAEDRRTVRGLDPARHGEPERAGQALICRFLGCLAQNIGGARLDREVLREVLRGCAAEAASRAERQELMPLVRGILAAEAKDARTWNLTLAELTAAHAAEAKWGDHRWRATGLASLSGVMLLKRGVDAGLACRVRSEYLPMGLVARAVSA